MRWVTGKAIFPAAPFDRDGGLRPSPGGRGVQRRCAGPGSGDSSRSAHSRRARLAGDSTRTPTAAGGTRPAASATSARRRSAGRRSWRTRTGPRGRTRRRYGRSSSGWRGTAGSLAGGARERDRRPLRQGSHVLRADPDDVALAGLVGSGRRRGRSSALPFELACLPQSWFASLRLPVVSYALPALIAIGQVRLPSPPAVEPAARLVRGLSRGADAEACCSAFSRRAAAFWKRRR